MDKREKLNKLKQRMLADDSLPLKKGATNLVFGDGNPDAEILFIGEGPGYWEDVKGIPFVGNAGAFLNQLLLQAGLSRQEVFITNVVHHRPPQNRDPEPEEISAYQPYLDEMIDIVNPKLIVTLGRFSMAKFLPNAKITSVHGKKFDVVWRGKTLFVIPMFHPAAGLRNDQIKRKTIEDFRKLGRILQELIKSQNKNKNEVKQMNLI